MGILDRFLKKQLVKLSASFQDNELIKFYEGYSLKKETILEVQTQQSVSLFGWKRTGEALTDSFVSEEGEYSLDRQSIGTDEINILFLSIYRRVKRRWHSRYQPSDQLLETPLSGEYSMSIENPILLTEFLKKNYDDETLHDAFIDQWVGFSIDQVLMSNAIQAKDIIESGDRLTSFLCQVLQEDFRKYGLILHKIKRAEVVLDTTTLSAAASQSHAPAASVSPISPISPSPKVEPESKSEPIIIDGEPKPLHDDEKIYYRVKNATQLGPYSSTEIQRFIDQNDLLPGELLWRKGLSDWKRADSFDLFIWD